MYVAHTFAHHINRNKISNISEEKKNWLNLPDDDDDDDDHDNDDNDNDDDDDEGKKIYIEMIIITYAQAVLLLYTIIYSTRKV